MKKLSLCTALIIYQLFGHAVDAKSRVVIEVPSHQQEADYVWRTIRDINFFEQQNYTVSLPQGALIDSLLQKARDQQLADGDYAALKLFIRDHVYSAADYLSGQQKISGKLPVLNGMIKQISEEQRNWDFKEFDTYRVRLTLYGPGGSFNPDDGSILILTTTEGGFKQYKDPANIIIHEVTHIGLEHSIIQRYGVSHGLKERIVDSFVLLNFKDILPEYRMQPMGDQRLDQVLTRASDLSDLANIIEKFVSE